MARRKGRLESSNLLFAPITTPTGTVLDFAGAVAPAGWLLCDGSQISRTTYATLFAALSSGAIYGTGNGTTTFHLPDCRGRTTAGKDDMGGSAANRITSGGSGITGTTLGNSGGSETHTLTEAQLAVHTHIQTAHHHTSGFSANGVSGRYGVTTGQPNSPYSEGDVQAGAGSQLDYGVDTSGSTATNNNAGSSNAHNNTQPTMIFNKIIKT